MLGSTGLKNKLRNLPHKKNILTSLLFLSVIALITVFSPHNSVIKNQTQYSEEESRAVLGKNTPSIRISGGDNSYSVGGMIALASTDEPSISITSYNTEGEVDVTVYEANEQALLDFLLHDEDGDQINKSVNTDEFREIKKLKHTISDSRSEVGQLLLPLEDSGVYFLKIRKGDLSADSFVLRSENGVIVKEGDNELIFWGQNYKTKRSMTEGSLSVYNLQDSIKQIENAEFNSQGIATTRLPADADIALIRNAGDKAIVPINLTYLNTDYSYSSFNPKEISTRYFTFTDRPLYRPGDTIYFKSIIRDDDDARYSIPTNSVIVKIFDDWGEDALIYERVFQVSGSGSIDGELTLPENAKTGDYYLKVETPGRAQSWFNYNTYFNVEHFRKPEYTLDISLSEREYIKGDKIPFVISGKYFSGHPINEGNVEYKVFTSNYYDYEYIRDADRYLNDNYRYSYYYGDEVDVDTASFDKDGLAKIEIDAEYENEYDRNQVYSIEATYNDASGNPVYSRKNILVYAGEFGIYRDIESDFKYTTKINEKLNLPLILAPYHSADISGIELTAQVKRENWVQYQEKNKKYPSYRKEEEDLKPIKVKTNSEGKAVITMTPTKIGSYIFTVEGKDKRGNVIKKTFRKRVVSESTPTYFDGSNSDLAVKAEKESYLPGETARLNITSSTPDRDVLLTFDRARTNRYQVVKMDGNSTAVDVPLVNTDMPNIYAKVSSFSEHSYDTGSSNIVVSPESKKLLIDITPDKEKYGPGDNVTINVSSTDIGGNPVSAEVAVWAVDKALFELATDNLGEIFNAFWQERSNGTQESHSLRGISVYSAERGGGCFAEGTLVTMADGSKKQIEKVKKGEFVLTRVSENNKNLVKAKVIDTHKTNDVGYVIVNGNLRITVDHILRVNNTWKNAGSIQVGDILVDVDGKAVEVDSIEWLSGKFDVYNLSIDKYNTFFANDVWVHNQKGGYSREVFKDLAYWNPTVRTNDAGRAQVSFKLPDNLTTWAIVGVGATNDTKVGQIANELIVTKDVIVRPVLPNILRVGDELVMSTLIQNSTDEDQNFDIGFQFAEADVKSASRTGELIESKTTKQFFWDTKVNTENEEAKLTYYAQSQENEKAADRVVQTIPVREFGFSEKRAETGNGNKVFEVDLAEDSHLEKSSVNLSIAPTILGTLPTAMNYLVDYPYGCVEQTTSRLVPAIIAKANAGLFSDALKDKDIDEIIADGLKRLEDHQGDDGGWAWWGHWDNSDPFVTAYVVEHLVLARTVGVEIDDEMIDRATSYLQREEYRDYDSNSTQKYTTDERIMKYYALTLLGEKDKVKRVSSFDDLDPDILAYAVMTNHLNGDTNPNSNGLTKLNSLAKSQGDGVYWEAGDSERFAANDTSTALAIRAIVLADGDRDLAVKGSNYLTRNRKSDYWSNSFGTAQVVRAITELSKSGSEQSPNYNYQILLDGKQIAQGSVTSARQSINEIEIPAEDIKKGGSKIEVKKVGGGQIYSTLLINEFHTDRKAKAQENGLKITRKYVNDKGERYSLGVGDTVTVHLTVSGLGAEEYYGVIEDQLPSGMIPINQSFNNEKSFRESLIYSYGLSNREITENGIVLSLRYVPNVETVYKYKARVISEGKFSAPPAIASLMYAPEINARTNAETIEIDSESKLLPGEAIKQGLIQGSKARVFLGVVFVIIILVIYVALRKRGIIKVGVLDKIKSFLNRIKRKPPIPPLQGQQEGPVDSNENLKNDQQ